jgi:hypothetical protein
MDTDEYRLGEIERMGPKTENIDKGETPALRTSDSQQVVFSAVESI